MDNLTGKKFDIGEGGVPQKRVEPIRVKLSANKAKANIAPAAKPSDLTTLWDRDFSVYRAMTVKVVARKGSMLSFKLIDRKTSVEITDNGKPFTVDLDDGKLVWSDLPSTAQMAKPGSKKPYGFLLLSDEFFKQTASLEEFWKWFTGDDGPSDPPKVPRTASL